MPWTIDSCILLDVALKDPKWGIASATFLDKKAKDGFTVCPVSVIEISPQFSGRHDEVVRFLNLMGVDSSEPWTIQDTARAVKAWSLHVEKRRKLNTPKRPIADILIGAFACRMKGLITRNPDDFKDYFPGLKILVP